ncbi:hypothetical protein L3X38_000559 [Prunus dulcis]|uniref:Uncharacterized protein n=1 Tax=Prunus dulcis TaxID=3755 RepID=A0AAD4WSW3_PRUDU|nr:hypothetical protein L3X38_000559 [Prunus dulcis]
MSEASMKESSCISSVNLGLATEEKSLLLDKIGDINEVSRQEVDEMINMFARQVCVSSSDNIQKRTDTYVDKFWEAAIKVLAVNADLLNDFHKIIAASQRKLLQIFPLGNMHLVSYNSSSATDKDLRQGQLQR